MSPHKQTVIAVTQGMITALTAYSYVMNKKDQEIKAVLTGVLNIPGKKEGITSP